MGYIKEMLMFTLNDIILLQSLYIRKLMQCASRSKNFSKLKFMKIIRPENFDDLEKLSFYKLEKSWNDL